MEDGNPNFDKFVSLKTIGKKPKLLGSPKISSSSSSLLQRRRRKRVLTNLSVSTTKDNSSDEEITPCYDLNQHYDIVKTLGLGTYALVQLGEDKDTGALVAIKRSRGDNSCNLLKNEYQILKKVSSSKIIKALSYHENYSKKESYLIMEYFEGKSLDKFIEEKGVLSEKEARFIFDQILSAVDIMHTLGIAHRDIKPENILINEDLEIKLIDFNISKLFKSKSAQDYNPRFRSIFYTQISSPLYAAPEIKNSVGYTESVDIWGLGIVLFTLLCGTLQAQELDSNTEEKVHNLHSIINLKIEESKCNDFLLSLLSESPEDRPTISECLSSSWAREDS